MPDSPVGPDTATQLSRGSSALQYGRELRTSDPGQHSGGAHRSGTDADLHDVRARLDQVPGASRRHDVSRDDRYGRRQPPNGGKGVDHSLLMTVGGVQDDQVDLGVEQRASLTRDVPVHAERRGYPKPPLSVGRGSIERRPKGIRASKNADEVAPSVDDRGKFATARIQQLECRLRVDRLGDAQNLTRHHLVQLREPVDARAVGLGDDADGLGRVDDDERTVGSLVQQGQRITDGARWAERECGVMDEMSLLHPTDRVSHHFQRHVLRQDGEPTAARVMFATTIGMGAPLPSWVLRSTSKRELTADRLGTMKTSS